MSDSLPPPASNLSEYTVGELAFALKRTVEDAFGRVRVRGEISDCRRHSSGHVYLTLKDDQAVLKSVCWRGTAGRLKVQPQVGLEVICTGRLTTYPGQSQYQLVIDAIEPAGVGALMALLDARRRQLADEGLFEPARKRPLPYLPQVIGVVTSPTGAVIRDIRHRLADRFPRHVLLWPVAVQGEAAAGQVAAAIAGFNRLPAGGPVPRPDVLIVARGGGSLEDLWAFNEEAVVRAAAASEIPLISAVGHETDTTLIDFAADVRAPTPTAAAEMAVPVRSELLARLAALDARLIGGAGRRLDAARTELRAAVRGLRNPREIVEAAEQRLDDLGESLRRCLGALIDRRTRDFHVVGGRLQPQQLRREVADKERELAALGGRLAPCAQRRLAAAGDRLAGAAARLRPRLLRREVEDMAKRLDRATDELGRRGHRRVDEAVARLAGPAALLDSLSYRRVLDRGYALVRTAPGGPVVAGAGAAAAAGRVSIEFRDGAVGATVDSAAPGRADAPPRDAAAGTASVARPATARTRPAPSPPGQGRLF